MCMWIDHFHQLEIIAALQQLPRLTTRWEYPVGVGVALYFSQLRLLSPFLLPSSVCCLLCWCAHVLVLSIKTGASRCGEHVRHLSLKIYTGSLKPWPFGERLFRRTLTLEVSVRLMRRPCTTSWPFSNVKLGSIRWVIASSPLFSCWHGSFIINVWILMFLFHNVQISCPSLFPCKFRGPIACP